jgi:glycosyltransferase involved in cell wall biosynthesis
VVTPFLDRRHGTERALAELLVRLAGGRGWEIVLYAERVEDLPNVEKANRSSPQNRGSKIPALDSSAAAAYSSGGKIVWRRIPGLPGPHLFQFCAWLMLNSALRCWDRHVRGIRCDLVLSPCINCLDADAIIVQAIFHRVQEVAQTEPEKPFHVRQGFLRRLHRRTYYALLVALERKIYGNPRVSLTAVSQRTANFLRKYFGRTHISLLRNAVDLDAFTTEIRGQRRKKERSALGFAEGDFVFLLIGNDWPVKGVPTLLEALAQCRDLPVHALVVGAEDRQPYLELAQEKGIRERLHFARAERDVMKFYAAADCYASPTREDACALPPTEAMACGLPVITSVENGGSEIIQNGVNGFVLTDPLDAVMLADIMRRLCVNTALCGEIGARAAQTAQQYSWDRNAEEGFAFLESALAKKKALETERLRPQG